MTFARARLAGVRLLALAVGCAGLLGTASAISAPSAAAVLGEKLFFDKSLSADGSISCATCHRPDRAFADGRPVAEGIRRASGTRNTPSLLNVGDHDVLLWDGRRETLESQVLEPLTNPLEHGLSSTARIVSKLRGNESYRALFERSFGRPQVDLSDIAAALAAYVRSLGGGLSRFDRYWSLGDKAALNETERYGLEVFRGPGQCASCHVIDGARAKFTDDKFHSLGVGHAKLSQGLAEATRKVVGLAAEKRELAITAEAGIAALGRFNVSLRPSDIGKYRTPSLRNVEATGPYMHDGSVTTLEEAVDRELYYRSASMDRPLILTPGERASVVAFLRSLTSTRIESSQADR